MEQLLEIPENLLLRAANKLSDMGQSDISEPLFNLFNMLRDNPPETDEQAAAMSEKYPAYWRALPKHWLAVDTYRVNRLFPVDDPSGQLLHSRKKLLVPGCRTGGKSVYDDIKEAHATLGAWLADNKPEQL